MIYKKSIIFFITLISLLYVGIVSSNAQEVHCVLEITGKGVIRRAEIETTITGSITGIKNSGDCISGFCQTYAIDKYAFGSCISVPGDSYNNPSGCQSLAKTDSSGSNVNRLLCIQSSNDPEKFPATRYCCPVEIFSGGNIITEVNCTDPDLEKELNEAISADDVSLAQYLETAKGCTLTYDASNSDPLECSLSTGEQLYCLKDNGDDVYIEASESFKGCNPCYGLRKEQTDGEKSPYDKCTDEFFADEERLTEAYACIDCVYGEMTDGEAKAILESGVPTGENIEPTGALWTELGCIDPSPAGVITRVFQIALGIMGGIAVIRFIQIALVYQSNDPDKIAEGPQMIVSLIGGIILLILGIIVLRFLGINVLGLPEGFLG